MARKPQNQTQDQDQIGETQAEPEQVTPKPSLLNLATRNSSREATLVTGSPAFPGRVSQVNDGSLAVFFSLNLGFTTEMREGIAVQTSSLLDVAVFENSLTPVTVLDEAGNLIGTGMSSAFDVLRRGAVLQVQGFISGPRTRESGGVVYQNYSLRPISLRVVTAGTQRLGWQRAANLQLADAEINRRLGLAE